MDLHAERLNVVGAIRAASEIRQVELDLVPSLIKPHGHGADERLHACRALVVGSPEAPPHVLVVEDLHFKREILFQILDDHHKKWQLDAERFLAVARA
eukprot:CAMPEP_0119345530 /NCGR_PEP_ID=MMETSP1333-20130426/107536_1 /TAXON_ID=418940 /ORGANISM="Scyphosphaera apsteinii, Strain RCC1455" /LENGTH=97 /DNA_ID=CAMNT_0007358005 /DNA_START=928 /DNA_END=1221 /DNA_ORIENTATION=+